MENEKEEKKLLYGTFFKKKKSKISISNVTNTTLSAFKSLSRHSLAFTFWKGLALWDGRSNLHILLLILG